MEATPPHFENNYSYVLPMSCFHSHFTSFYRLNRTLKLNRRSFQVNYLQKFWNLSWGISFRYPFKMFSRFKNHSINVKKLYCIQGYTNPLPFSQIRQAYCHLERNFFAGESYWGHHFSNETCLRVTEIYHELQSSVRSKVFRNSCSNVFLDVYFKPP